MMGTKARVKSITSPEEALDYIGMTVRGNARELEGALAHVKAFGDMLHTPLTLEIARQALSGEGAPSKGPEINMQRIMSAVTERFGVKLTEVRGPRRHRSIVLARQACMW